MSHRPDLAPDHPWRRGAMRQANFTPLWAVTPQALGLEYAGHFNWALRRGHRSRPLSFAPSTPHSLLAVGLLTMDSELAAEKRTLARSTFFSTFSALRGEAYEARYLLLRLPPRATDPLAAENATHGDLLRLATREGRDRCWLKVILWLDHALAAFPRATFVGITDDDVYLQLHRIALELAAYRSVPHVYWGQPMWMSHWNHTRFEGARFGGYLRGEGAAFGEYEARCERRRRGRDAPRARRRARTRATSRRARARAEAAGMPGGPFVFMNTDPSVFSADLARAILRGRCRHFKAGFRAAFPPQHGEISDDAPGAARAAGRRAATRAVHDRPAARLARHPRRRQRHLGGSAADGTGSPVDAAQVEAGGRAHALRSQALDAVAVYVLRRAPLDGTRRPPPPQLRAVRRPRPRRRQLRRSPPEDRGSPTAARASPPTLAGRAARRRRATGDR